MTQQDWHRASHLMNFVIILSIALGAAQQGVDISAERSDFE